MFPCWRPEATLARSLDCSGPSRTAMAGCGGYRNQDVRVGVCAGPQTCPTDWASCVSGDQTRHDPGESLSLFREERRQGSTLLSDEMLHRGGVRKTF